MQVSLRHAELPVSSKFLNRSWRRSSHRQMRAERVTQDVHALLRHLRSARRAQNAVLYHLSGQRLTVVLAQHVWAPQMPMIAERGRESDCEPHIPQSSALRCRYVAVPLGPLDAQLPLAEIDVSPLERDHLAAPKARFPA